MNNKDTNLMILEKQIKQCEGEIKLCEKQIEFWCKQLADYIELKILLEKSLGSEGQ